MRSPIGPMLVVLGLATVVVLVLVLFQSIGLRSDLDATRAELETLRGAVESREEGVSEEDLVARLDELEAGIRDWLIATGADGGFDETPGGSGGSTGEATVADRLDEILERIDALNDRIDEICDGVPVC
ncbi:MAG TPA: hypothetical protein VJ975_05245 [Candidatus Limnocylindria bacterium]|nr:hypothetical protein [Candidatus Limnocylindria bacterium]